MSWGAELWDKYEDLCRYSATSIDFLENSVADFIKERGKVEKEYAKNLRALVKKYTPKTVNPDKNSSGPQSLRFEDEFSHLEAYKEVSKNKYFKAWLTQGSKFKILGSKSKIKIWAEIYFCIQKSKPLKQNFDISYSF